MDEASAFSDETEDDAGEQRTGTGPDPYDVGAAQQALNDAAKRVNAVWISFVLVCVYVFIATYTVTPAVLFREAPVKLPIFNADLPLKVYFLLAPLLILCLHAYLIVLTKDLAEKVSTYEDVLSRSANMSAAIAAARNVLYTRLDNSIVIRAISARYRDTPGFVDVSSGVIAGLTMTVLPVVLLLLTQLKFLPYQEQWLTWAHRGFVIADVFMCLWLLRPFSWAPWLIAVGRLSAAVFALLAAATSIVFATFPAEWIYTVLYGHWPHAVTAKVFEGPPDPVDYVHKGGVLPFPNRLILPDDPKLNGVAAVSAGSVSLSVRGRNFRKAVFDRSNLTGVDFSAADLTEASLHGAKLEGAKFECARPAIVIERDDGPSGSYSSTFRPGGNQGCTLLDDAKLPYANLDRASFKGAQLSGADLEGASVQSADFGESLLIGASFSFAEGSAVNFSTAYLTAADFRGAHLTAAIFDRAMLQGARFSRATLIAANFDDSHMQAADLSGAELLAASFTGAYLQDVTLDGANMKGASFVSASLRRTLFKCVTPFRTNFADADLLETVVNVKECELGWYDASFDTSHRPADKYDLKDDHVPVEHDYGYSDFTPGTPEDIYKFPEKLSAKEFERQLNDFVLSDLSEEAKPRVRKAFERLKPGERTKDQDEAEKTFWADWAKRSASQASHDEALANRLESIACVAEGAPYVARSLLRAGRFDWNDKTEEQIKARRQRFVARLKAASGGSDLTCLGARGLRESDFPSGIGITK
jgi:uncharacterized protein YjbI with pentapeptide repeats